SSLLLLTLLTWEVFSFCCRNRTYNGSSPLTEGQNKVKQCKEAAAEADRLYKHNIDLLEKARIEWELEHINTCQAFQQQERDRITILRNSLWVQCNHFSEQCVKDDEMIEEVRQSLENCDINAELDFFIESKTTGMIPPEPVLYEDYCGRGPPGSRNGHTPAGSAKMMKKISNLLHGCGGSTKNLTETEDSTAPPAVKDDIVYASIPLAPVVESPGQERAVQDYTVLYDYMAQNHDELDIGAGDVVKVIEEGEDGWWTVERNGQQGLVPGSYIEKL
ncbi:proline-serine-threonine phosphatase-interacting protein 1-like, partial [Ascaphus truei]|uniref:proline-serine-threonine phosphatase-interacting protein 1-like n=1 Tax=Ascaphus truei TaxID=8439 RepID=UPI003F5A8A7B